METRSEGTTLAVYKPRRPHRKSRLGCFACKKRQVKCDESKPSCTRCSLTLRPCEYPPAKAGVKEQTWHSLPRSSSPCSFSTLSPRLPPEWAWPPSQKTVGPLRPTIRTTNYCCNTSDVSQRLSNAELYHHYLAHTCSALTRSSGSMDAWHMGFPTLALRSRSVFHSLLALSAVCLCHDVVSSEPSPSLDKINEVLMTTYHHYNLASEQMRGLISKSDASNKAHLLASTLLLIPVITASQQIAHWVSSRKVEHEPLKRLSTDPREVIIMIRGVKATIEALELCDNGAAQDTASAADSVSLLFGKDLPRGPPQPSTHALFTIVAATSSEAFLVLQRRLERLQHRGSCNELKSDGEDALHACTMALDILMNLRTCTFPPLDSPAPQQPESTMSGCEVEPWLQALVTPHAEGPSASTLLRFYGEVPEAYLEVVLPLLDERLESPSSSSTDAAAQLTDVQAIALDIYAHWSVLMLVVEEESWWIGKLPVVTLKGMVNRYGDHFATDLGRRGLGVSHSWWPGSMLAILEEVNLYR